MPIESWSDALDAYCAHQHREERSPSHIRNTRHRVGVFVAWCDANGVTMTSITKADSEAYKDDILSRRCRRPGATDGRLWTGWSRVAYLNGPRAFLRWLTNPDDERPVMPGKRAAISPIHAKTPKDLPKPFWQDEVQRLWDTSQLPHEDPTRPWLAIRDFALLAFALETGARNGEVRDLKMDMLRVDGDSGRVLLDGKSGPEWDTLTLNLRQILRLWLDARALLAVAHDAVFINNAKTPYTQNALNEWCNRLGARAGVDHCHFHRLRHTAATDAAEAGDMLVAQALMRHKDMRTTMKYVGLSTERKLQARERSSAVNRLTAAPAPGPRPMARPEPAPIVAPAIPAPMRVNLGEANGRSKLSRRDVAAIKRLLLDGMSKSEIARHYPVTRQIIIKIAAGAIWTDVEAAPVLLAAD